MTAASVSAAVASRGRVERMMEDERLGGTEEGDSSGMLSVIAAFLATEKTEDDLRQDRRSEF